MSEGRNWPGVSGQVIHVTRVELCFFPAVSMGAQFGVASVLCSPGFSLKKNKQTNKKNKKKNFKALDFSGGPVAETLRSQSKGPRFNSSLRN